MMAAHAKQTNSAYAPSSTKTHREEDNRNKEGISEVDMQTPMGWTTKAGYYPEQEPEIINEQEAAISSQDIPRQGAHIVTPEPLLLTGSTMRTEDMLAPVAKPLPRIFAGPVSPDTGRTIPQFSGEEFTMAEDCEAVEDVIANGKDSILLQSLREGESCL